MPLNPFDQLDHDWATTRQHPHTRAAYQALRNDIPTLATLEDPDAFIRAARRANNAEHIDQILASLTRSASAEPIAARLVLQALLPGLKLVAIRLSWADDTTTVDATVIATAWELICGYPHGRRPRRIAANIIRDTQSRARRELHHPRETPAELPVETVTIADDFAAIDAADHIRRSAQRGRITQQAADVIVQTRFHQRTFRELALATGDSEDVLRRRRERAEARLRQDAA